MVSVIESDPDSTPNNNNLLEDDQAVLYFNNQAPTDIRLSSDSVEENVGVGTVIGSLITDDPDSQDQFTYQLVSGDGDKDNGLFSIIGDELRINVAPDFELNQLYNIRVSSTDQGRLSLKKAFTINVNNQTDRLNNIPKFEPNTQELYYDLSVPASNVIIRGDDEAFSKTVASFHNIIGLYRVENANGAIIDSHDANGNGSSRDLLNPGDPGYAATAISNRVNGFKLQLGAFGAADKNTTAKSFGDVIVNGGALYAPFVIANGGKLIPNLGSMDDGINAFLAKNGSNRAATADNYLEHEVAYFAYTTANPDLQGSHLKSMGHEMFGFEDLPGNLGISDRDFDDAVFRFIFNG